MMRRVWFYLLLLIVVVSLILIVDHTRAASKSAMDTIYVSRSSPEAEQDGSFRHPFSRISKALAFAAEDAHIHIASGSYYENLRITKLVHLHGDPSSGTVIVGSLSKASIVLFETSGSLDNVTMYPDPSYAGIENMEPPIGIAIRAGAKTVEINSCVIDSCSVGVETAVCDASVMINGSALIRNQYGIGAVLTTGTVYCANSQITDNLTGVFDSEADLYLFNCTVVNNWHGIHIGTRYKAGKDCRVVMEGNKIENNLVTGLWFDQGTPELRTLVDLGGGGWSAGRNEVGENKVYDIFNNTAGGRISALNNTFGTRKFVNSDATSRIDLGDSDQEPPSLTVDLTPKTLGSANRRMVPIHANLSAKNNSGSTPLILLSSIVSDQAQSNTDSEDSPMDIQGDFYRSADTDFELRAEITQGKAKRIYTITYVATDASGNSSARSATTEVVK